MTVILQFSGFVWLYNDNLPEFFIRYRNRISWYSIKLKRPL